MAAFMGATAFGLIGAGLVLFVEGLDKGHTRMEDAGIIAVLFSFLLLAIAYGMAWKEKREQDKTKKHLIVTLDAIAKKLGVDVDKVHKEKRGKED